MRRARPPSELGLTGRDVRRLDKALHAARDARHFRRLLAVKLVAEGKTVAEAARLSAMSRPAVYAWVERYVQRRRPEALEDAPRAGRPREAQALSAERLRALVAKSPTECGWASGGWTVPLLCAHLAHEGCSVSCRTLRRRLHEAHLAWKRPRYVYALAAPHLAQKKGGLFAV
ncbi:MULTISPECIES: helix-turn-helix domain-containing protein [Myxococcaceae]|uniref:helix-turn-helix domain-containing protein n=1 Tax=Myxococcaceae TaxID=31 RepID=UPI00188FB208|nr:MULTISPECIES: helix-turn-helix domain-containing protein [Myxococcaceae]MBF5044729.1 helix-turn-helix domain-containing protein [Simulacricoccus sp. 17bor-14]